MKDTVPCDLAGGCVRCKIALLDKLAAESRCLGCPHLHKRDDNLRPVRPELLFQESDLDLLDELEALEDDIDDELVCSTLNPLAGSRCPRGPAQPVLQGAVY